MSRFWRSGHTSAEAGGEGAWGPGCWKAQCVYLAGGDRTPAPALQGDRVGREGLRQSQVGMGGPGKALQVGGQGGHRSGRGAGWSPSTEEGAHRREREARATWPQRAKGTKGGGFRLTEWGAC